VLALLQQADHPLDVLELSRRSGLHANTVRGHLQVLQDLGRVERQLENRKSPGRPRVLYQVAAQPPVNPYQQLAAELAAGIAQMDSTDAALAAGRSWASRRKADRSSTEPIGPVEAAGMAVEAMRELGFEAQGEPLGDRIYLTSCPFEDLARRQPSVCSVHEALLTGFFSELGSSAGMDRLDSFVRDSLCVAHLRTSPEGS
jgi:predicted ArsR family transcriptional regulator